MDGDPLWVLFVDKMRWDNQPCLLSALGQVEDSFADNVHIVGDASQRIGQAVGVIRLFNDVWRGVEIEDFHPIGKAALSFLDKLFYKVARIIPYDKKPLMTAQDFLE